MQYKEITLRVRTPLFMGHRDEEPDVDGKEVIIRKAALKAAAFKGILRWWFRALHGFEKKEKNLFEEEEKLFGSTNKGAPFKMTISKKPDESVHELWTNDEYKGISSFGTYHISRKGKPPEYNGLVYFARNLYTAVRNKHRIIIKEIMKEYIPVDQEFTIRISSPADEIITKIQMLLWLSLQFGGFGARSRRCFGNLEIVNPEELSLQSGCFSFKNSYDSLEEYNRVIVLNISLMKKEMGIPYLRNPVLSLQNARLCISKKGWPWKWAIYYAGTAMQVYRAVSWPDYNGVRNIKETGKSARAGFGLPLEFRFSQPVKKEVMLNHYDEEDKPGRLASPVIASLTKCGQELFFQYLIFTLDYSHINVKAFITEKREDQKEKSGPLKVKINKNGVRAFDTFLCNPVKHCKNPGLSSELIKLACQSILIGRKE